MAQFGVRDELGKSSVVTGQVLLEKVLAPSQGFRDGDKSGVCHLLARVLVPSLSTILNIMSALIGTSQTPS